jgi:hypothetical protein
MRWALAETLGACRFRAVSQVFHACYAWHLACSPAQVPVGGAGARAGRYRGAVSTSQVGGAQTPGSGENYAGERFGLPQDGAGSVASIGRRLVALLIDWLACMLIAEAAFRSQDWTLAIFAAQDYLLTSLTGFTLGKRLAGIRVARLDSRPVFVWDLVRTLLLLLVVPPLVTDLDLRGLHDRAAGTIVVRV